MRVEQTRRVQWRWQAATKIRCTGLAGLGVRHAAGLARAMAAARCATRRGFRSRAMVVLGSARSPAVWGAHGGTGGPDCAAPGSLPTRPNITLAARRLGTSVGLDVGGELDIATAPYLYVETYRLAPAADWLILDLSVIAFIDGAGLGVLDRIYREVTHRLRIVSGPAANRLFAITNAHAFLPIGMGDEPAPRAEAVS